MVVPPEQLLNLLVSLVIVLAFLIIIYTKMKNQSMVDTFKEIKGLLGVGTSGIRKR